MGGYENVSPIVLRSRLWRDNRVIAEKLKYLGEDESGVHGDLQVILSSLRRMELAVKALIAVEEGERAALPETPKLNGQHVAKAKGASS
jgi:hypothetical protein